MINSKMFYEAFPDGTRQGWKVFWNGYRGGYSETISASDYRIFDSIVEATAFARELKEKNKTRRVGSNFSNENIGIERCFIIE